MKTVVGIFETAQEARDAVERLREAGVPQDNISLAMREAADTTAAGETDPADSEKNARAAGEHPAESAAKGMAEGALAGAGIGAVVGLAAVGVSLLIPGLGAIILGGPIAAAAAGAGIGMAPGTLIGALIGAGVPEDEATSYAKHIEAGQIIVSAHVEPGDEARARTALTPVA
jgi:hypothetical protein